jgi:hypothetical protein
MTWSIDDGGTFVNWNNSVEPCGSTERPWLEAWADIGAMTAAQAELIVTCKNERLPNARSMICHMGTASLVAEAR